MNTNVTNFFEWLEWKKKEGFDHEWGECRMVVERQRNPAPRGMGQSGGSPDFSPPRHYDTKKSLSADERECHLIFLREKTKVR